MSHWKIKLQELFGIDIRSLALFRIGLALVLIGDLFNRIQDLGAHYTDDGLLPRNVLISHFLDPWHFSLHLINGSWQVQFFLFAIAIVFACTLLLGFYTRLSTIFSWILLISLQTRNPLLVHGGDTVLRLLLFWGMFLPLGSYWSLDYWFKRRDVSYQFVSAATCALLLQVCFIYWFSALLKTDVVWRNEGTAVWYAFSNDFFAKSAAQLLLNYPVVLQILTFSTLFLEFFGPFFAFSPFWTTPIRTITVFVFIFFHLALGVTLELGIFSYVCVVAWIPFLPGRLWNYLLPTTAQPFATQPQHNFLNILAIFLFAYIALWNLRGIYAFSLPPQFNALSSLIRIDQYWNMFAPFPLREDGWFLIPATLRNGKQIDLYTSQELNWQKPERCSACFKNDRWRSFMLNLVFDDNNHISLAQYARYLWQQWDSTHPYEEQLLNLDIIFMSKRNSLNAPPQQNDKFTLWTTKHHL